MAEYDLVIRNGQVFDGSEAPGFAADVAVKDGIIARVGQVTGGGAEEIDATGLIVTPGFVDIHTHYDGQATWEDRMIPSSDHGATTVVVGNCGVGFAPCRTQDREKLVKLMEGVEDIPEVVMADGLPWNWETFPDYLDRLAERAFDVDVGAQLSHSPLRVYVMGERGAAHEASTETDRAEMARLVAEAVRAGALGVSTSRSHNHRHKDGRLAPSVNTAEAELLALAEGLAAAKSGVFQLIPEMTNPPKDEMALVEKIAQVSRRPVSFSAAQVLEAPSAWRGLLAEVPRLAAAGHRVRGQVHQRPVGVLLGLDLSFNPLSTRPSYRAIAHRSLTERVTILRDPTFKARVLAEQPIPDPQPLVNKIVDSVGDLFALTDAPNYEAPPGVRLAERARAAGVTPLSLAYDLLLEDEGHAVLCLTTRNRMGGSLEAVREMMVTPHTVLALGDGGAHCGFLVDAVYPTFLLSYWARDAALGQRFPLEWAVASLTRKPAETVGLLDRGLVAEGHKADLNVIDHSRLKLHPPRAVYTLPAGGRRLRQRAEGYAATVVSGQITYREGEPTGALPGRLVRGAQAPRS